MPLFVPLYKSATKLEPPTASKNTFKPKTYAEVQSLKWPNLLSTLSGASSPTRTWSVQNFISAPKSISLEMPPNKSSKSFLVLQIKPGKLLPWERLSKSCTSAIFIPIFITQLEHTLNAMNLFVVEPMYQPPMFPSKKDWDNMKRVLSWQSIIIHQRMVMDRQGIGAVWPNAIFRSRLLSCSWKTWARWSLTWFYGRETTSHTTFGPKAKITTWIILTQLYKGWKRQPTHESLRQWATTRAGQWTFMIMKGLDNRCWMQDWQMHGDSGLTKRHTMSLLQRDSTALSCQISITSR